MIAAPRLPLLNVLSSIGLTCWWWFFHFTSPQVYQLGLFFFVVSFGTMWYYATAPYWGFNHLKANGNDSIFWVNSSMWIGFLQRTVDTDVQMCVLKASGLLVCTEGGRMWWRIHWCLLWTHGRLTSSLLLLPPSLSIWLLKVFEIWSYTGWVWNSGILSYGYEN